MLSMSLLPALVEESPLGGASGPELTRYFLVCGGLLLATAAMVWAFRKFVARSLVARAARRSMQVMDVLPLGGRQKLAVVRCYDRTFLLGLGDKELSLVSELDPAIEPEKAPAPERADREAFARAVERMRESPLDELAPKKRRAVAERALREEGILG